MAVNLELLKMARQHVGKRHLSKYAFVAAGDPAMGAPMPSGGAPPMDPMAMGMGGPPAMPMAAPGAPPANREEIGSPLDSLGKILYDVDITTLLLSKEIPISTMSNVEAILLIDILEKLLEIIKCLFVFPRLPKS